MPPGAKAPRFDLKKAAKLKAWQGLRGMARDEAMRRHVTAATFLFCILRLGEDGRLTSGP